MRPMSQIERYDLVFLTIPWIAWLTWELLDLLRAFDTGTWKYPIALARSTYSYNNMWHGLLVFQTRLSLSDLP